MERQRGAPTVSSESLLFALDLQLEPYNVGVRVRRWSPPASARARARRARALARQSGAQAAFWYRVDGNKVAALSAVRPGSAQVLHRSLSLAGGTSATERVLAVSARTMLEPGKRSLSRPEPNSPLELPGNHGVDTPPRAPAAIAAPGAAWRPAPNHMSAAEARLMKRAAAAGWVSLGADYVVRSFPLGGDVRHGPEFSLAVRLWRGLSAALAVGLTPAQRHDEAAFLWTRAVLDVTARGVYRFTPRPDLTLDAGLQLRAGRMALSATRQGSGEHEEAVLWDLSLGTLGSATFWLSPRLGLRLMLLASWVTGAYRMTVLGRETAAPGAAELAASAGVCLQIF